MPISSIFSNGLAQSYPSIFESFYMSARFVECCLYFHSWHYLFVPSFNWIGFTNDCFAIQKASFYISDSIYYLYMFLVYYFLPLRIQMIPFSFLCVHSIVLFQIFKIVFFMSFFFLLEAFQAIYCSLRTTFTESHKFWFMAFSLLFRSKYYHTSTESSKFPNVLVYFLYISAFGF